MTDHEAAKALAKRIIHDVNLGECWEDPTHEGEIAIVADILTAALHAAEQRVWEKVEQRCKEQSDLNQKAHDRALAANRRGVALCRQSDCETLDAIADWCRQQKGQVGDE